MTTSSNSLPRTYRYTEAKLRSLERGSYISRMTPTFLATPFCAELAGRLGSNFSIPTFASSLVFRTERMKNPTR